MQIAELYGFSRWFQSELRQLVSKYNSVAKVLQHNASQQQKQPLEGPLDDLINYLQGMDFDALSMQQVALFPLFDVQELVGKQGVSFVESTIRKSDFDPATAHQNVTDAVQRLQSANQRVDAILQAFDGLDLPLADPELEKGRVLVRVEFAGEASMHNVAEWKSWSASWYEIVRGVAIAIDETPEETQVIGASQGSVIMKLAATYAFTRVLALISKSISSIAKDYLEVRHSMEDLKAKKLLNKKSETALKANAEEIKTTGVETIMDELRPILPDNVSGDKENALKMAIEKALDFHNKGGDVDFVAPDQPVEEGEDEEGIPYDEIAEVRIAIEEARAVRNELMMLADLRSDGE
ncbi:hypothetical protein MED193_21039 [Roseobacter sp. MED193]|uniref:hypothetical protein n=1 Tax=Roseobacter sp. MED193 TaxID=314262 RepID=UPI000068B6A8|nr:hypothetical protein [Roseobacter sp. MED193]EAQ47719.1 hypothetical protein MED193_21039 [Roseobacter sp. MED193]